MGFVGKVEYANREITYTINFDIGIKLEGFYLK